MGSRFRGNDGLSDELDRPPRALQRQARLCEDRGARWHARQGPWQPLHRPEARRDAAALGFPAGDGRRPQELGSDARAEPRSSRQTPRSAHRGSSAELRDVRGDDSARRIWRRHGDAVGRGHLGADQGQEREGSGQGPPPLHPERRADEGRMAADPPEAARQGEARELAAAQDRRCRGGGIGYARRNGADQRENPAHDAGDRRGEESQTVTPAKAGPHLQRQRQAETAGDGFPLARE